MKIETPDVVWVVTSTFYDDSLIEVFLTEEAAIKFIRENTKQNEFRQRGRMFPVLIGDSDLIKDADFLSHYTYLTIVAVKVKK
jgi:hypothetical protein